MIVAEAEETGTARLCPGCGEALPEGANPSRVYCGTICRGREQRRRAGVNVRPILSECRQCGATLGHKKRASFYCSRRCRNLYNNRLHAERNAARRGNVYSPDPGRGPTRTKGAETYYVRASRWRRRRGPLPESVVLRLLDDARGSGKAAERAKRRLVDEVAGAVLRVAHNWRKGGAAKGLDEDDLRQIGAEGVMEAIAHYDPGRGYSVFGNYAMQRAEWKIRAAISREGLIRPPQDGKKRPWTVYEAEAAAMLPGTDYEEEFRPWDALIGGGVNENELEEDLALAWEIGELKDALDGLAGISERERLVIETRYGLYPPHEPATLTTAGEAVGGVSRERARQLQRSGEKKLKDHLSHLRARYVPRPDPSRRVRVVRLRRNVAEPSREPGGDRREFLLRMIAYEEARARGLLDLTDTRPADRPEVYTDGLEEMDVRRVSWDARGRWRSARSMLLARVMVDWGLDPDEHIG